MCCQAKRAACVSLVCKGSDQHQPKAPTTTAITQHPRGPERSPSMQLQGLQQHHPSVRPVGPTAGRLPAVRVSSKAQSCRSAIKAVSGQVRETASSSSNGSKTQHGDIPEPDVQQASMDTPKQQFNWFKQWYPVAILEDLEPRLPMHAQLLGKDLAIWWDSNAQQWRAFQDRCPHRLAPLSEGIIDAQTGHLYCSYHGWTFSGEGRCTSVPQLPQDQHLSTTRSCVSSYPTRCAEGLLWVWPDASPTALIESADPEAWPGLAPELDTLGDAAFSKAAAQHKWYARDMPYPWLAAKENAYNDPSHDAVLHHGVSAFANRARAQPISMKLAEMTPVGYKISESSGAFDDITRFPCGARRERPGHAGVAYVVPTGVGTVRQFHTFLQNDPPPSSSSSSAPVSLQGLGVWLRGNKPTWMQHMFSHVLIDADIAIQARVDYNRAGNDHVYMPAAADAGPASFMRWLKEYGQGGPPVTKLKDPYVGHTPPAPLDRRQLLDRFTQHTQHCKACRTAYSRANTALQITGVLALLCGSAAVALAALAAAGAVLVSPGTAATAAAASPGTAAAAGGAWGLAAVLTVLAGVLGGAYAALQQLVQKFVFVDYDINHVGKRPGH